MTKVVVKLGGGGKAYLISCDDTTVMHLEKKNWNIWPTGNLVHGRAWLGTRELCNIKRSKNNARKSTIAKVCGRE